ncbi:MAG TPA: polysaccharide biosynthesis/export family protein [Polyangiaceae bacterium]
MSVRARAGNRFLPRRGIIRLGLLGLLQIELAAGIAGCSSGVSNARVRLPPPSEKTTVGAGDIVTIQIVGEKDLPQEYEVASDGTVMIPYIQTVTVAGLEPRDIAAIVRQKLIDKKILVDPTVVVQVKEYHSRTVIMLGQVAKPGSFPLTPGLTLMQAISLAGGLTSIADDDKVTLTRKVSNTATRTVRVSVDAITDGKEADIPLQAGDRVYVYQRLF